MRYFIHLSYDGTRYHGWQIQPNGISVEGEIERCLSTLTEIEREVIRMYFGIGQPHPLSLDEIAMKFNLTRERVRQIKEKGIKRLKNSSKSKHLKAYL